MTIKQNLVFGFSAISAILFAAVCTTLILTNTINETTKEIVEERMPSTEKSSLMLTGINSSLASLGGWLLTGNEQFKKDRANTWEVIDLTTINIDLLSTKWQSQESIEKWSEVKLYLEKFKQIQQKVEGIGHTLEEKPANKILIEQANPIKSDMFRFISLMIDSEKNHIPDSVQKSAILTALRAAIGYGGMIHNFKNYVLRGTTKTRQDFEESIKKSRALLDEYIKYPMSDEELFAVDLIRQAITHYSEKSMIIKAVENEGNSPELTDKKVRFDDSATIEALTFLDNVNASTTSGKQHIASRIRVLLGYNGFIHHYKNYLLRKDLNRKNQAEAALDEVAKVIHLYRLLNVTSSERSALQDLERVIKTYRIALNDANKLIDKGANAETIDRNVRIDDQPALKALAFIDASIANSLNDPEEAIKLQSATLQDRARLLGTMSDFRNTLSAIFSELQAFLITGQKEHYQLFQAQWDSNTEKFIMLRKLKYLMLPEQLDALEQLTVSRDIFTPLPNEMFDIRRSERWNMTNYLLATEVMPLTEKILGLLAGERNKEGRRDGGLAKSERVQLASIAEDNASSVAQLNAIQWLLLLAGLVTAFFIGKKTEKSITEPLKNITEAMTKIASGGSVINIEESNQAGEIGHLTKAASIFQQSALKTEDENWKKTQIANTSAKAQEADTLAVFCQEVIDTLTPLVNGSVSAFYVYKPETELLEMEASHSFMEENNAKTVFKLREGVIGQSGYEQRTIIVSPVPDDFIKVSSALGSSAPETLIVLPVIYRNNLLGVIEIASLSALSRLNQELLEEMMPAIALSLEKLNQVLNAKILLDETKRQAEQLQLSEEGLRSSEEELRVSEEELRVINEELVENTRGLEEKTIQLERARLKQNKVNQTLSEHNKEIKDQQRALEKALSDNQLQTEEIKQSSRYKSEFLANMSHELRTPLNSLLILSKSLAENEDGDLNSDNVEAAEIIYESGTSLLHRINEILDLSKVEAGQMLIHSDVIMLDELSHGIKRTFKHVAAEKKLDFIVELDEKIPMSITSDIEKIVQVLDNLIANAIKFTEKGSVTLLIKIPEVLPEEINAEIIDPIQFSIIDTGIGINPEHLQSIFEAFRQADGSTSRQYGGTGLGLSISKKFTELLGGFIHVESEKGKGSVFSLILPRNLVIEAEQGKNEESEYENNTLLIDDTEADADNEITIKLPEDNRSLAEIKKFIDDDRNNLVENDQIVLVVEDDTPFAEILVKRIQSQGFKAIATDDPYDAILLANILQPMGIVLDIELPQMDGIEVYKQLNAIAKTHDIPVHFMSASNAELRTKSIGGASYFTKPVTKEQIDEAINSFSNNCNNELQSVLIIDSDPDTRNFAYEQFNIKKGVEVFEAATGSEALEQLQQHPIDCIILELNLPDINGTELLERISVESDKPMPQVVVYSSKDLSEEDVRVLRRFTDSLILKDGSFVERLQDEVMLFLDSVKENQNHSSVENSLNEVVNYNTITHPSYEIALEGKTVLVVDDDMRNTFALSRALSDKGMKVLMAKDGAQSITMLEENPQVDIILMDSMMPGMDGNEATAIIRSKNEYVNMPILMVTAKTMKGDKEVSMAAGASDYLPKPIDMDKLLSMMRAWL
jgi:signal transduction histidine kinase/DNA-binding response OmpR family regulator/CHASE3 domain sensor protein/putative methionine-R-sulfoxide reductase with GAF domain